jgi:hypothetical protein
MRIVFERTGGFAAVRLCRTIDSRELQPGEVKHLDDLLKKSRFFELPARLESPAPAIDRFHYKVTVESKEGMRTIEASEASIPADLRPLIDYLTSLSRR